MTEATDDTASRDADAATTAPIPDNPVGLEIDGGVATIRLQRPPMNPFDTAMSNALIDVTRRVSDSSDVRACLLHGGPHHFAAGADVDELAAMSYEQIVEWNARLHGAFDAIARLPVPVVAAVNGYALGGGLELALAADVRIGSTNATVGLPEITLGILPGSGGTQRLTQIVGRSAAKLLIMTGRHIAADEAHRLGIIDQLCAPQGVLPAARDLARQLATSPRYAIRAIKEAVDAAQPVDARGLALERAHLAGMFATEDRDRAMGAYLERRLRRRSRPSHPPDDATREVPPGDRTHDTPK